MLSTDCSGDCQDLLCMYLAQHEPDSSDKLMYIYIYIYKLMLINSIIITITISDESVIQSGTRIS